MAVATRPELPLPCDPRQCYRVHPTRAGYTLRTSIEIDDKRMADALRATGAKTKKEVVELGLRMVVGLRAQEKARELRGKIVCEGDLSAMRIDR